MPLVEAAGTTFTQGANTNTVTTGSLTPSAGLLVAIIGVGNGDGNVSSSMSVTDTSGSGSWTAMAQTGFGTNAYGGVWIRPEWSGAATVTATIDVNVFDICIIVRQFSGAAPVAAQLSRGATAVTTNTTEAALSITPNFTGSQCVGGFGTEAGAAAKVANATTTIYGQYDGGTAGDTEACIKATSLSVQGTAISLGFTVSVASSSFALAEIIPYFLPNITQAGQAVNAASLW